jgi:molybdopterin-containing oxidoreductase family iron-sulfur binding subunit
LAATPEFKEILYREFPKGASEFKDVISRRRFLKLMGASMALAGLTACRRPVEKIVPYVTAPEQIIPGIPQYFATTMPFGSKAYGLVVESHEGRPTKIEGNKRHPSTRGASNAYIQAAILELYDPDRSQLVLQNGSEKNWTDFVSFWQSMYPGYVESQGEGLAFLNEAFSSPTNARLKYDLLQKFPKAKWFTYEPVSEKNIREGVKVAGGNSALPLYHFEHAKVIVALDADFLLIESENIVHSLEFINGRRLESLQNVMNRLYVIESNYSTTGAMADHRKRLPSSHIPAFTIALTKELEKQGLNIPGVQELTVPAEFEFDINWIRVLVKDLLKNKGKCLLIASQQQPVIVHALIFAINHALQNTGKTITFRAPMDENFEDYDDLVTLVNKISSDRIKTLFILGGNPVYNTPADLNFKDAINRVEHSIHLSFYVDETSIISNWHLPRAHFLESWGDARASDGTTSIIQPLIAPLFESRSSMEILNLLITGIESSGYELVRNTWRNLLGPSNFEKRWRRILHDGLHTTSASHPISFKNSTSNLSSYIAKNPVSVEPLSVDNLEIVFRLSPAVYDGRFANNGWLQELPNPVTKISWDNAAVISPKTADLLEVKNEDMVVVQLNGKEQSLPVWVLPGQADFSIDVALGYGRHAAGRIGNGIGFNTYRLRTSQALHIATGGRIRRTINTYKLANVQDHHSMMGRPIIREAELAEFRENPKFAQKLVKHPPLISLWEEHSYEEGYQWGMTIDLNSCTGCNACVIACQSENNIPIIGKEQVRKGREMHWIRIDRYFSDDVEESKMLFQPVACHHCENAPCEQVCPVAATVHDSEGLNLMTYNRCIGTRYCSNNCPYKVRRFNFFNYTNNLPEIVHMVQNPDVTVRSRGVMEKCTYCLQRISEAKINAKKRR